MQEQIVNICFNLKKPPVYYIIYFSNKINYFKFFVVPCNQFGDCCKLKL